MAFTVVQFKKFLSPVFFTASAATVYTVPAASQDVLKCIDVCNTSGATVPFTVYLVPSGGSATAVNSLFASAGLPPNSTMHWTGTEVLNTGDFISIVAGTTNVLTFMASGLEST